MTLRDRIVVLRPPRMAMALLAAAVAIHLVFPFVVLPPSWMLGMLVGIAGLALMLRAWWLFRMAGTPICPTEHANKLLTGDVYGLTRNPMYLGIVMMMLAFAISFGTAGFYAAAAVLFAILNFFFCPFEEDRLRASFAGFGAYARRVRRWI